MRKRDVPAAMRSLPLLASLLLPLAGCPGLSPAALAQVGVTIRLGDPGYYGRLDRLDAWNWELPPAALIAPRPVMVLPPAGYRRPAPLYLRVPPGHARNWSRHCQRYGACGVPVYFVRDDWYRDVYVPRYRGLDWDRDDDGDDWRPKRGRGRGRWW